jgi:phosphatidate cytidylyltransferase
MCNLLTRTLTGILFLAVVVGAFFLPHFVFYLLFTAFAIIGIYEYVAVMRKNGYKIAWGLPMLITLLLCSATCCFNVIEMRHAMFLLLMLAFIALFIIPIVELYRKQKKPIISIAITVWPLLWIAVPFALVIVWQGIASSVVLAMLIIIWIYDTLAYCAGSLFGKHRLIERISPKKSWEGFLISLCLTSALSVLFYYIPYFQTDSFTTIWQWTGFAIVIILSATFGDLVESLFKRSCQVKDSGHILPGHGGILDRFDSLLFAGPAGAIYYGVFLI